MLTKTLESRAKETYHTSKRDLLHRIPDERAFARPPLLENPESDTNCQKSVP